METIENIIKERYNLTRLPNAHIKDKASAEVFKNEMLAGVEKLKAIKDSLVGKDALVMGLGPSLLDIDKEKYKNHVKIVCNHFYKVPNFYDEEFKPDYWCGANALRELAHPVKLCLEQEIPTFVTIPRKEELSDLVKIGIETDRMNLFFPWMWEEQIFQRMLAEKYGLKVIYSLCNTVTNHMIALGLWLGCKSITITGFDLSYSEALKKTGMTHAGYNEEEIENEHSELGRNAFDNKSERLKVLSDLKYLCSIAQDRKIKIENLSHNSNGLPQLLAQGEL